MEFANAAIADSAREFRFDQRVDFRIVEPGFPVGVRAVGTDERHDTRCRDFTRRGDQRARAVVRTAGGENGGDAVGAKDLQDVGDRKRAGGLVVVVQMGIEEFRQRLRTRRQAVRQGQDRRGNEDAAPR